MNPKGLLLYKIKSYLERVVAYYTELQPPNEWVLHHVQQLRAVVRHDNDCRSVMNKVAAYYEAFFDHKVAPSNKELFMHVGIVPHAEWDTVDMEPVSDALTACFIKHRETREYIVKFIMERERLPASPHGPPEYQQLAAFSALHLGASGDSAAARIEQLVGGRCDTLSRATASHLEAIEKFVHVFKEKGLCTMSFSKYAKTTDYMLNGVRKMLGPTYQPFLDTAQLSSAMEKANLENDEELKALIVAMRQPLSME